MARKLEQQARDLIGKNWSMAKLTNDKLLGEVRRIARFMEKQGLQRIQHMKTKHIDKFVSHMKSAGMDHGTMANYLTTMRKLAAAIGKKNIVAKKNEAYGISRAGLRCRPRQANLEKIHEIRDQLAATPGTEWMAVAIQLAEPFGLRFQEALMSKKTETSGGEVFLVVQGAKNGRPRSIPVNTPEKEQALAALQKYLTGTGQKSIMPPELSLKQAYDQFRSVYRGLGGTKENDANFHLLRHHHAQGMHSNGSSKQEIIDEASVYNHALTDQEILNHFLSR